MWDLLIRGGQVVDGSGSPPYRAGVAVKGDRIAAVGTALGAARREIDAAGLVVAPGFIDIHTHARRGIFHQLTHDCCLKTPLRLDIGQAPQAGEVVLEI